jgi:hypothetical protein
MSRLGKRALIASFLGLGLAGVAVVSFMVSTPGSVLAWCGGILAAAAAAYLGHDAPSRLMASLARRGERKKLEATGPFTYTAGIRHQDYVTLPDGDGNLEVPASGHTVQLVVTGAWPSPVILTDLRPEILTRANRSGELARHAAEIPVRQFEVLLDPDPPHVRPLEASTFLFAVKRGETEVFDLLVTTNYGDVQWVLWLDWSAESQTGSVRIDLGGHPFRTAARHPTQI